MGGGGFSPDGQRSPLDDFLLELTGRDRPRVCFIPTASGDDPTYVAAFYRAYAGVAEASDLPLFARRAGSVLELLKRQDLIYVGGGNTANLLALWRVHGVDIALREAFGRGTILAGLSAGAICWFEGGSTDSFGPLAPLHDGLGLLAGSFCPHYDGEPERRPTLPRFLAAGLPAGFACDDGAALHFRGGELLEAVSAHPGAGAYRVSWRDGVLVEVRLAVRRLTDRRPRRAPR